MPELNMTTSAISGISSFGSLFNVLFIVGISAVILSLLIIALSSLKNYKRLKRFIDWFLKTFGYFFIGLLTLFIIAIPSLIIYFFISQAHKGNIVPLKYSIYIIGGYFLISLIGYLAKKFVYNRVKNFENKLNKTKKQDDFKDDISKHK